MAEKLTDALIIILLALSAYWMSVIIHECGHLIAGKLSGYTMAYFRVGSFVLRKENGQWQIRRLSIPGTLGQCVMIPPESEQPENVPMILYHAGGGLINLLTSAAALPFFFLVNGTYVRAFFLLLGMFSLAFALLNLYPYNGNVPNDGYNLKLAMRSAPDRAAMYRILRMDRNPELSPGEKPLEDFQCEEDCEYRMVMEMLAGYRHLDNLDFAKAEDCFRMCVNSPQKGMEYYRFEAKKELLFCLLMRQASSDELKEIGFEELMKQINAAKKHSAQCSRISYTYDLMRDFGTDEDNDLERAYLLSETLTEGDRKMERTLLSAAGDTFCNTLESMIEELNDGNDDQK